MTGKIINQVDVLRTKLYCVITKLMNLNAAYVKIFSKISLHTVLFKFYRNRNHIW